LSYCFEKLEKALLRPHLLPSELVIPYKTTSFWNEVIHSHSTESAF